MTKVHTVEQAKQCPSQKHCCNSVVVYSSMLVIRSCLAHYWYVVWPDSIFYVPKTKPRDHYPHPVLVTTGKNHNNHTKYQHQFFQMYFIYSIHKQVKSIFASSLAFTS